MTNQKIFFYIITTFLITLFLMSPTNIIAQNIFGLHLTQTSDINMVDNVINSSGGDWGWVTITIRIDQLNQENWQNFFDICRQKHLIPLLRLATKIEGDNWVKPTKNDIDNFVYFLSSLNWPTTTQHIILFNEVNRSEEWGGLSDPIQYADIATYASQKFKQKNSNFFILTAGLDLSAPQLTPKFISADNFYKQLIETRPNFFDNIDGLASHSYPNPGFVGKPTDSNKFSIKGYLWELNYLKNLGINKDLPVYITETGWPHRQGKNTNNSFYTVNTSVNFLIQALNIWAQDNKIIAVTPFIYNYPYEPFDHFSWLDSQQKLYPAYNKITQLTKQQNHPYQTTKFEINKIKLPFVILPDHQYTAKVFLKNTGQSIWSKDEKNFCLSPQSTQNIELSQICTNSNSYTMPGQSQQIEFTFTLKKNPTPTKTFIGWQGTNKPFEITPIIQAVKIYRPKTHIIEKIKQLIQKLPF